MADQLIYAHIEHDDDRRFVWSHIHHAPEHIVPAIMSEYLRAWRKAARAEKAPHRKDNAGRREANLLLRRDAAAMESGDKSTMEKYTMLVQYGPAALCSTCKHCTLKAECSKEFVQKPACPEWQADFT